MQYIVTNHSDGNDQFPVDGKTTEEAALAALEALGYGLSGPKSNDEATVDEGDPEPTA